MAIDTTLHLTGRVVLVTGAAGGIGRATVETRPSASAPATAS
jgi:NADP-dependent 3-hydroxy acid dehydrogenase YdfG